MKVKVSHIHLTSSEEKATKGFAHVTVEGAIAIHGIRIVEGKNGLFVAFPSEKGRDGNYYETVHPVTAEARQAIHKAVLEAFERAQANAQSGPDR